MKINFSKDGNFTVDVKFEENELNWANNKTDSFDNFVNNLKEMFVTSNNNEKEIRINEKNNEKEMRNAIVPPIIKGIETINNISNNLYNYYTNETGEKVPDLPYK